MQPVLHGVPSGRLHHDGRGGYWAAADRRGVRAMVAEREEKEGRRWER